MTQPHPQPTEYIITMARIIKARNMLMVDGYKNADVLDRMVNLLRSRPHTPAAPATEPNPCALCPYAILCSECDLHRLAEKARKDEREQVLDEMVKLTMMIETNESETWERVGRPKNDGYINGSHSGYGHALRDIRQWIDQIKQAESLRGGGAP